MATPQQPRLFKMRHLRSDWMNVPFAQSRSRNKWRNVSKTRKEKWALLPRHLQWPPRCRTHFRRTRWLMLGVGRKSPRCLARQVARFYLASDMALHSETKPSVLISEQPVGVDNCHRPSWGNISRRLHNVMVVLDWMPDSASTDAEAANKHSQAMEARVEYH